jgi:uncharacterized membrane protein YfcA
MLAAIPFSLAIGAAVIVTSIISGIFGMAGGLVLMLILGLMLPVQSAMVLHGVTQFFSNGWRAWLWRQWIDWKIVGFYAIGASPAIALPLALSYVPDKAVMLLLLGAVPYLALALPKSLALDASKPKHAIACGFSVAGLQLLAGVAGRRCNKGRHAGRQPYPQGRLLRRPRGAGARPLDGCLCRCHPGSPCRNNTGKLGARTDVQ